MLFNGKRERELRDKIGLNRQKEPEISIERKRKVIATPFLWDKAFSFL